MFSGPWLFLFILERREGGQQNQGGKYSFAVCDLKISCIHSGHSLHLASQVLEVSPLLLLVLSVIFVFRPRPLR